MVESNEAASQGRDNSWSTGGMRWPHHPESEPATSELAAPFSSAGFRARSAPRGCCYRLCAYRLCAPARQPRRSRGSTRSVDPRTSLASRLRRSRLQDRPLQALSCDGPGRDRTALQIDIFPTAGTHRGTHPTTSTGRPGISWLARSEVWGVLPVFAPYEGAVAAYSTFLTCIAMSASSRSLFGADRRSRSLTVALAVARCCNAAGFENPFRWS